MFAAIKRWWRQRMRDIDHDTLFPQCRALTGDDRVYRTMLAMHIRRDPNWNVHLNEMSERDRDVVLAVFGGEIGG